MAHIRCVYNDSRQFRPLDVYLNHRHFVQEKDKDVECIRDVTQRADRSVGE